MNIRISILHEKCQNEWHAEGRTGKSPEYQTSETYEDDNVHGEDLVCQRCGDQIQMWTEVDADVRTVEVDA